MGKLTAEERPVMGQLANEVRERIETSLSAKHRELTRRCNKCRSQRQLDVTASKDVFKIGHRHPLNNTIHELENLFISMGFDIITVRSETVANNFDDLNSPKDHPSRDKTDTFYITEDILLRTQTSPVQVRTMKSQKPPIRMVSAGRTFRFDDVDDTHSPMFHQIEGLVIDEHVTMANLIETINVFIRELLKMKTAPPHYSRLLSRAQKLTCLFCVQGRGFPGNHGWSMELLAVVWYTPKC